MRSLIVLLILGASTTAHATANYVYHEQTTATTGGTCGAYLATPAPTSADAYPLEAKVEYQFFTNMVAVYYTTDGSLPAGALGVGGGTTSVLPASYACTFDNGFGQLVDVATASLPAQPAGTTVKYIVSAWHAGEVPLIEVFANSGTCMGCGACTTSTCATSFAYTVAAPPVADLAASIVDSPDPTFAGDVLHLQVTASNAGPDDATGVTLTTNLPTTVSIGALPAGCMTVGATTVACALPTVAAGTSVSQTIDVTPLAGAPPSITTTVSVASTGPTADPNAANDMAAEMTTVGESADVGVTVTAPASVSAGSPVVYAITIANAGPNTSAAPIIVTNTLPASVTVGAVPSGCMTASNVVTCSIGALAVGASAMLVIDTLPTVSGPLDDMVSIATTTHDGNATNDSATAHTVVATTLVDAATTSDATAPIDAATSGRDAATSGPDAATNAPDAGAAQPDAGGAHQASVGCGCDVGGRGLRGGAVIIALGSLELTMRRRARHRRRTSATSE